MINKYIDKASDKLPAYEQFSRSPSTAWAYALYILFFVYFVYEKFLKRDDCENRLATIEHVVGILDKLREEDRERIRVLEDALDMRNRAERRIRESVDSLHLKHYENTGLN